MLRIANIDEISNLLLLLPDLVRQQEQRSVDFVRSAAAWLNSLEQVLTANRLYHAGKIATLRGDLVAAEHGQVPAGLEFRGHRTRTKIMNAAASQALQRAADIVSSLIAENRPRLVEAERIAQQIIAAAASRKMIIARKRDESNTEYLRILRRSFVRSEDLESAVVHLEGLVGPHDTLILLDRALAAHAELVP